MELSTLEPAAGAPSSEPDVALALAAAAPSPASDEGRDARLSAAARPSRVPGMGFGHEVLLALIMAVAMAATLSLYR